MAGRSPQDFNATTMAPADHLRWGSDDLRWAAISVKTIALHGKYKISVHALDFTFKNVFYHSQISVTFYFQTSPKLRVFDPQKFIVQSVQAFSYRLKSDLPAFIFLLFFWTFNFIFLLSDWLLSELSFNLWKYLLMGFWPTKPNLSSFSLLFLDLPSLLLSIPTCFSTTDWNFLPWVWLLGLYD